MSKIQLESYELQQAQLAMEREMEAWKDFENYLPQLADQNVFIQKPNDPNDIKFLNTPQNHSFELPTFSSPNAIPSIVNTPENPFSFDSISEEKKTVKIPSKKAHNVIERRYRNNINDRISELQNVVPALSQAKTDKRSRKHKDSEEYLDGITIATKLNKATILRKSTEYILHLKRTNKILCQENDILQRLIRSLPGGQEALETCFVHKTLELPPKKKSRTSSRVFMATFMAISFFSSTPLFTGPTTQEEFESHHHISRTADDVYPSSSSTMFAILSTLFSTKDSWSTLRTTLFIICLFQLLPLVKSSFLKRVRVKDARRKKSFLRGTIGSHVTTPGDQKCMQIYTILAKSLQNDSRTQSVFQQGSLKFYLALLREFLRFGSRHWLGYDILYEEQLAPQEQWVHTCKLIKLNEIESLGGNPRITRPLMLFSCLRVINLIEAIEDENEYVEQSRSRVFATAALQMALIVPHHGIAQTLARYFWGLAMYESGLQDDPLMAALTFDCHEDDGEDRMEVMIKSRAWSETLEVMNHQIHPKTLGLSLSMNAPVLVPVGILSTLHLLDNLQTQFGRLIISVTDTPYFQDDSDFSETVFSQILDITTPPQDGLERANDYLSLAHWLAAVGAVIETLWKADTKTAETLMNSVLKKVPLSIVSREIMDSDTNTVEHKERLHQLDDLTKKIIIHTLAGSTLLKKGDLKLGLQELLSAERLKITARRLSIKSPCFEDVESSVMSLAEFVTAVTGLEAWITAWRLIPDDEAWEQKLKRQICNSCLQLRRMIGRHSFDGLRTNDTIVERLTRLGAYTSRVLYECSDEDDTLRRSDRALDILRGIA